MRKLVITSVLMTGLGLGLVSARALADARDDLQRCDSRNTVCVGFALLSFMETATERILRAIAALDGGRDDGGNGGGGGGDGAAVAAGLYVASGRPISNCTSINVSPRNVGGQLRRIDVECFPSNVTFQLTCQDSYSCSDANGRQLQVYDGAELELVVGNETAVYQHAPGLYDGAVRLAAGTNLLQIFHAGRWAGVCDDAFDANDGQVVCRQLGRRFVSFSSTTGDGQFWMDDLGCTGSEQRLAQCSFPGWGVHNCSANEAVAVVCEP